MNDFLNDFSAGKIKVKYYLIEPLYSPKRRGLISLTTALVVFVMLIAIIKGLSFKEIDTTWMVLGVTVFMISVPTYFVGKLILNYNQIGILYFHEDHVSIETKGRIQKLPYEEIIKIEYCGSLPKDIVSTMGFDRPYVSSKVRFYTGLSEYITVEATRDMFLSPEEREFFSNVYPVIEHTLKAIQPRYGISKNSELKGA